MIRIIIGVEACNMDVREIIFKKSTRERLCIHLNRLCMCQYLKHTGFLTIKMCMNVTGGESKLFYLGGDSIILDDINSGLNILKAVNRSNKLNAKKLFNLTEVLCHFVHNLKSHRPQSQCSECKCKPVFQISNPPLILLNCI